MERTAPARVAAPDPPAGFFGFLTGLDVPPLFEWTGTDYLRAHLPDFSWNVQLPGDSSGPASQIDRTASADPVGSFLPTLSWVPTFGGIIIPTSKGGSGSDPGKPDPDGGR